MAKLQLPSSRPLSTGTTRGSSRAPSGRPGQAHGPGFVVWCIRKLPSGDKTPEVLPLGTFTWTVEMDPTNRSTLRYRIQLVVKDVPFHVTEWVQPNFNVNESSILHATVQTPLAHLIEEYRILRETIR